MGIGNENILVIKKHYLCDFLEAHEYGFLSPMRYPLTNPLSLEKLGEFKLRTEDLEADERFVQLIPYQIVVNSDHTRILVTKRTKKQSEKRLHDLYSIGVGGHLNEGIKEGMLRELKEELNIENFSHNFVGTIYNSTDAVGRVHLGLAYLAETDSLEDVTIRETENMIGFTRSIEYLLKWKRSTGKYPYNFEGWSAILLNHWRCI